MGIVVGQGANQRDWSKVASAAGETIVQGLTLGKDGFSGAVSAFFRVLEGLRGDDNLTRGHSRNIEMLNDAVMKWLVANNKSDRIRLISGGPGSGKSTFAKYLACQLAQEPRWRVIFVPLQRLRGSGPLENRIDEYFRLQRDEPFAAETTPLASLGRDEHHDWVIIFDGLDELAKEGAGSESAAQDFASALADWRGGIGQLAVRFIVLGRAPSMQEASRRLGLQGPGTLNVDDMLPWHHSEKEISEDHIHDPGELQSIDQRQDFWGLWATAKGLAPKSPAAMSASELDDLTKEPLLAYLLIFSGYATDRWKEAAENKNRIYGAIFDQIWERERVKPTRVHLNDLGAEGFRSLMQALGLAAWRGGGRTGDEETFVRVRDVFVRPDLLSKAKAGDTAGLNNVALLFYTRRDEQGGRGYEFLHKSFGEYLTACGLLSAFQRWGKQVLDSTIDFDDNEFGSRWLKLTAPSPITHEILLFLRNEIHLQAASLHPARPWQVGREWLPIAEQLVNFALQEGLPAHETATSWRVAVSQARNAEESLLAMLDACARVAYPIDLYQAARKVGGWQAGPVSIPLLNRDQASFGRLLARLLDPYEGWTDEFNAFARITSAVTVKLLSRLNLQYSLLYGLFLSDADFEGSNLKHAGFEGATLRDCNFSMTNLQYARFYWAKFTRIRFDGANLHRAQFENADIDEMTRDWAVASAPSKGTLPSTNKRRARYDRLKQA